MSITLWAGFITLVLGLLALDLFVLNRKAHVIAMREALLASLGWLLIGLTFNVAVYFLYEHHAFGLGIHPAPTGVGGEGVSAASTLLPTTGRDAAVMFFTGYLVELMLSLDNMLVIAMIMGYFQVPAHLQHRVLFWGIIGAVTLRGVMIGLGTALVQEFHWIIYVFGGILILSAFKMLMMKEEEANFERNLVVRAARSLFNVSPTFDGSKFFTRLPDGRRALTPLMVALLVVEVADVIFAVDSIPAIFGITLDPFIVFASNCFAILGLRAIYFAVAALIRRFRYLKVSMVIVLGFIGVKMIAGAWYHLPAEYSLCVIATIIGIGIIASLCADARDRRPEERPIDDLAAAAEETWRRSRKIVILVLGVTILALSIPIGLLPGPGGIAVAIGGLALLATEFVWARSLLRRVKKESQNIAHRANSAISKKPRPWLIPLVFAGFFALVYVLVRGEHFESNHVLLAAIGPFLAICFWSYLSIAAWLKLRQRPSPVAPTREEQPLATMKDAR
ncbi:MAG: TerC/Alx family metal homeostasis membrane protein [Phycisphaerales bacterium]